MRFYCVTLMASLFLVSPLTAQNPAAPPANPVPPPNPKRLDQILDAWEKRMAGIDSFSAKVKRTSYHPLTRKATTYIGKVAFRKPDMALLDLTHESEVGKKDSEKTNFERFIYTGQFVYEYSPQDKKIIRHEIPKYTVVADSLIFTFLRGMKAKDGKKRFDLKLRKEDQWYAYVTISSKLAGDREDFSDAELTIRMKNSNPTDLPNNELLPCRMWYRPPTGGMIIWEFDEIQPNTKLAEKYFVPAMIDGYKFEKANPAPTETPMPPKR